MRNIPAKLNYINKIHPLSQPLYMLRQEVPDAP